MVLRLVIFVLVVLVAYVVLGTLIGVPTWVAVLLGTMAGSALAWRADDVVNAHELGDPGPTRPASDLDDGLDA